MKVVDLKCTFQYGMHGCGYYKGASHANSLEAMQYWMRHGVKVIEIDICKTIDDKFVAMAHLLNSKFLNALDINPDKDNSQDKFTGHWFMRQRLCKRSTGGLSPMNLAMIIEEMTNNSEVVVMFDLWGLWDVDSAKLFAEQIDRLEQNIKDRCVLEVYNKKMLAGIREVNSSLFVMYCVHGSSAAEFDENVSPEILKKLGVDIISYPWVCTKGHPGELEKYHQEGFTIFSLSHDNRLNKQMRDVGVNVNLIDVFHSPKYYALSLMDRVMMKVRTVLHKYKIEL